MASDAPKDISFETTVVDVCCHPSKDVIAAGDIDGDVTVYSYSTTEQNHLLLTLTHHKKACRALEFSPSGERLYSVSKDKSVQMVDMNSGSVKQRIKKAHESPVYSLLVVDENIVATGDDDGHLKVWDMRQNKAVMDLKENDEFISDMVVENNKRYLVATSGDGTLSAFDIRKHKLKMQSELFDSELLSVAMVKGGDKVVCGTGEGVLNIFNWGEWGNISDRFPGHPMSVDCLVPITRDIVITGSMDGIIRAVNILPNRFLGTVGEHPDFPIENLSLSHCGNLLASCSHDQVIKFWNIQDVGKQKVSTKRKAKKGSKNKPLTKVMKKNDFFSDLAEGSGEQKDGSGNDDSSDDSDEESDDSDVMNEGLNKGASCSQPKTSILNKEAKGDNKDTNTDADSSSTTERGFSHKTSQGSNKDSNTDEKNDEDSDFVDENSSDDDDDDDVNTDSEGESGILNESNLSSNVTIENSSDESSDEDSDDDDDADDDEPLTRV